MNNLQKYEKFFELDLKLKNILYDLAPKKTFDIDDLIEYNDLLFKKMTTIENILYEMCLLLGLNEDSAVAIEDKMHHIKADIANTNYTYYDLLSTYNKCFACISEEVLKQIKDNIFGDALIYDPVDEDDMTMDKILRSCSSINEILHALHSYLTNDIDFMRSIPLLAQKHNIETNDAVTLRGDQNDLALSIYNTIGEDFDAGILDIVSINNSNKILIISRDRGHALSIEIEIGSEIKVYYFIPKVINEEMVSKLKGVNLKKGDQTASGSFLTTTEDLTSDIFKLIEGTPTDLDIDVNYYKQLVGIKTGGEENEKSSRTIN